MTKYKFNKDGGVDDMETGQQGISPGVWLWEEYQKWLDEGNVTLPPQPSAHHQLVGGQWVLIIKEAQDAMWVSIKAERDRRKEGGFKVEVEPGIFKWYHSDIFSRTQHIGLENKARNLLAAGGALSDIVQVLWEGQFIDAHWKTMDGTKVFITAQIALDIVTAAESMDAELFYAGELHKATMLQSADPSSYDYSTGWPEVFEDTQV